MMFTTVNLKCVVFLSNIYNFFAEQHFEDSVFIMSKNFVKFLLSFLSHSCLKAFSAIHDCFHIFFIRLFEGGWGGGGGGFLYI